VSMPEASGWKLVRRGPKNSRVQLPTGETRLVANQELENLKSVLSLGSHVPVLPVTLVRSGGKNVRLRDATGNTFLVPLEQAQEMLGHEL
jgi:hypothetical protein